MNRIIILVCFFVFGGCAISPDQLLEKEIKSIIQGKKATVGVAVMADGKEVVTLNDEYHYPTMSVYKFHLALTVLNYLDKNKESLDTELWISKADLYPDTYSPLRDAYPEGDLNMSVRELLKYSVSQSDNNACDLLFKYVGGPEVVEQHMTGLGMTDVAIVATEQVMHEKLENSTLNWTTPSSAAQLMELFLKKELLSTDHQEFLESILIETVTGTNKLKGGLPANVVVGHKTGSSFRSETGMMLADNDLGFVRLPNGKSYTIAVFVMNSMEDDQTNAAIIAQISRVVYEYMNVNFNH